MEKSNALQKAWGFQDGYLSHPPPFPTNLWHFPTLCSAEFCTFLSNSGTAKSLNQSAMGVYLILIAFLSMHSLSTYHSSIPSTNQNLWEISLKIAWILFLFLPIVRILVGLGWRQQLQQANEEHGIEVSIFQFSTFNVICDRSTNCAALFTRCIKRKWRLPMRTTKKSLHNLAMNDKS